MERAVPADRAGRLSASLGQVAFDAAIVGGVVFAASIFGILTRPVGLLAALWPANALLLGLMVRNPRRATGLGWAAAAAGFVAADMLTGSSWFKTLLLTTGNLVGVVVGYVLFARLDEGDRRLRRPMSMLHLGLIAVAAATAVAVVGGVANPILFDGTWTSGWASGSPPSW